MFRRSAVSRCHSQFPHHIVLDGVNATGPRADAIKKDWSQLFFMGSIAAGTVLMAFLGMREQKRPRQKDIEYYIGRFAMNSGYRNIDRFVAVNKAAS
jgi:hypothetical protein